MTLRRDQTGRAGLTIAMDGPAGAGKTTLAPRLAQELGYLYVDTGAMYRALALKALRTGVNPENDEALSLMAATTSVELKRGEVGNRVFLDGQEVTAEIRTPEVERIVSRVSAAPGLRRYMVDEQRRIARAVSGVVMDGRDIGSYVLPDADLKFFITASLEERACRRHEQLCKGGRQIALEEVVAEIARRDQMDENKGENSLVRTPESIVIDTTGRSVEDALAEILAHCRRG